MKLLFYVCLCYACLFTGSDAQAQGFSISVTAPGFEGDAVYLAYYLADRQYVQDTAVLENGMFTFTGDEQLNAGFYLVVFPPTNQYFQLLIDEGKQDIHVTVNAERIQRPVEIRGSDESLRFYDYVDFVSALRPEAESLRDQIQSATGSEKQKSQAKLDKINGQVDQRQLQEMRERPRSLTAMLIGANREITPPEFKGTDEEVNEQRFNYYRQHYFDHIPLDDPRVIRTPFLHEKIDYFINKLTVQSPDSISSTIDMILSKMTPGGDVFKIYLVHFLNTYAKSKIVGMDAVYVHVVNEYYAKGRAPWTDEEQLNKIIQNAARLDPILIGKIAPDLTLQDREGKRVVLHEIEAQYTVLFFWAPDCGHCKKSIPGVIDFYNAYKSRGVEILAVCTKLKDEVSECWETIDERDMNIWINAVDPLLRSRYKQLYDVRLTPRIYVLDREKRIVMKSIGAEQLPEVLDHLLLKEQ